MKEPDYNEYSLNGSQLLITVLAASAAVTGISILFYGNLWCSILISPLVPFCLIRRRRSLLEKRKWELDMAFCDAIGCMSAALESGYSVENAVSETYRDMKLSYPEESPIMEELKSLTNKIRNNIPIEEAFMSLALRSGLDDIRSFADIFATAKRSGGNLMNVIRSTSSLIRTRAELRRETALAVASKKYEADIMKIIPFAVLLYLRIFSPEMTAALYGNLFGIVFMTVLLAVFAGLCVVSEKILDIRL